MRKLTDFEKQVFKYLNQLRESGKTNMFGARPYIMEEFDMESDDAKQYLLARMKIYNKEGVYEEIDATLLPTN